MILLKQIYKDLLIPPIVKDLLITLILTDLTITQTPKILSIPNSQILHDQAIVNLPGTPLLTRVTAHKQIYKFALDETHNYRQSTRISSPLTLSSTNFSPLTKKNLQFPYLTDPPQYTISLPTSSTPTSFSTTSTLTPPTQTPVKNKTHQLSAMPNDPSIGTNG